MKIKRYIKDWNTGAIISESEFGPTPKKLTILLNRGPYVSECADLAVHLALKAREKGHDVNMYLYVDGVWLSHRGQDFKSTDEFVNLGNLLQEAVEKGVNVKVCARCGFVRGVKKDDVLDQTQMPLVGIYDFVNWLKESDKVITFTE